MPDNAERVRHNHLTRDIRPKGECPACDEYHAETEAFTKAEIERLHGELNDGSFYPTDEDLGIA